MHIPAIVMPAAASLMGLIAALTPLRVIYAHRRRSRKAIQARLASLGETLVGISHKPSDIAAWGKAGLTGGAVVHHVVSRTADGEQRVREWAYDPTTASDLKTFAHGIWIPVA